LGDLSVDVGSNIADRYLTMWGASYTCRSLARTLGKGDVYGWQAIYE
jgi:hypothetical protein